MLNNKRFKLTSNDFSVPINDITKNCDDMMISDVVFVLNELNEKCIFSENSDINHYIRWIEQIDDYINLTSYDYIIKFSLSYTLQSLRNGEDLKRFKWGVNCI